MGVAEPAQPHAMLPAGAAGANWPPLPRLPAQLKDSQDPAAWRELLRQAHEELKDRFLAEEPVEELVHARAALVDLVLREAWARHGAPLAGSALVAVGGYGRGELHPASDIDLLLLVPGPPDGAAGVRSRRSSPFSGTSVWRSDTACARWPSASRSASAT